MFYRVQFLIIIVIYDDMGYKGVLLQVDNKISSPNTGKTYAAV